MKLIVTSLLFLLPFGLFADSDNLTALNHSAHTWDSAEWTTFKPDTETTVFLNSNATLTIPSGTHAKAGGFRIGNVESATATLVLDGGNLETGYIVIGDAPNGYGAFTMNGGKLSIKNTEYNDFEIGNPNNIPDFSAVSKAEFSGGSAELADIRFNLRLERTTEMSIIGSKAELSADKLFADYKETNYKAGKLSFKLDSSGVSTLEVNSKVYLGDGDQFELHVDGRSYNGGADKIGLIKAKSISGSFKEIKVTNFRRDAKAYIEGGNSVILEIQ